MLLRVQSQVMLAAKPSDLQRLAVIIVVHLSWLPAHFTRLSLDLPALQVNVRVAASIHLRSLLRCKRMRPTPATQILGVASQTVRIQCSTDHAAWIAARAKQGRHSILLH